VRKKMWPLVVVLALGAAACGSNDSGGGGSSDSGPYKVLFLGGTSSFVSGAANAQLNGLKAAAADLNKSGGINGHKIEIESVDTGADATKATSLLTQHLSGGSKPDFVLPGTTSGETLALLPTLTRNKILAVAESASAKINVPKSYPYGFSVSVGPILPATALATYVKDKGYRKVAVIGSNDAFGTSGVQAAVDAVQKAGLSAVSTTFPADAVDATPQLEKLKAASPDVLLYTANGTQVAALLKSRQKLAWTVPTIGDLATGSGDIWQYAGGTAAQGTEAMTYPVQPYLAPADRPQPLKDLYTQLQALGIPPYTSGITIYALAWDILHIVATAAKQADSIEGPKVAAALESLKQPTPQPWTVFKDETFSPDDHFLAPDISEFKVVTVGPAVDGMVKSTS
jgi:branched-chain amino acid transport system substrate-binding protein